MSRSQVPNWVDTKHIFWSPSVIKVGDRYVMYYNAVKKGFAAGVRCVGTASSSKPTGPFTTDAVERLRPLVCPGGSITMDPVAGRPAQKPGFTGADGVIDATPRFLTVAHRTGLYLTYKTQGTPSSIRMVRLDGSGRGVVGHSHQLTEFSGIEENPVMVQRGSVFTLFTSVGGFNSPQCRYRSHWRSSKNPWSWSHASKELAFPAGTRTCGTGNADVVPGIPGGSWRIFFNGRYPSGTGDFRLYTGVLTWNGSTPRVVSLFTAPTTSRK